MSNPTTAYCEFVTDQTFNSSQTSITGFVILFPQDEEREQ
jgi:hypothetical protein